MFKLLPLYSIKAGICTCSAGAACTSPGKHPLSARGSLSATDDPAVVAEWKKRNPGCNWGIATGHDGLVVVDIDPRHDGHLSWIELIERQGGYLATLMVKTGSGGTHLYYRIPDGMEMLPNSAGRIGKGIDIRGRGGYVVAPPSNHISGERYWWCEPKLDIATMPLWLYDKAKEKKAVIQRDKIENTLRMAETIFLGVGEGSRNSTAYVVCKYYQSLLDVQKAWVKVLDWNTKCTPPLPEEELNKVFHNSLKY